MTSTVRSAARVLDLLEYLSGQEAGASLSESCEALGLPKSSTLMLLRTLLVRGYILRDEADRYRLNETFRHHGFGWGGHRYARLIALAEPVMERLCAEVEETVLLGAADQGAVKILAKVVAQQPIRYDVELASTSPFYCTAMGRVLAAYSSQERCDAMLQAVPRAKLTPLTETRLDALRKIVAAVRETGIAIVEEEFALGGTGIATPIFAPDGSILASLDIGCVTPRFQIKRAAISAALSRAAATLTQKLALQEAR
ncbi:IclR family transcriptional regulator [Bosea sp. (in: a-proteobacteria)]